MYHIFQRLQIKPKVSIAICLLISLYLLHLGTQIDESKSPPGTTRPFGRSANNGAEETFSTVDYYRVSGKIQTIYQPWWRVVMISFM